MYSERIIKVLFAKNALTIRNIIELNNKNNT